ncbi:unnamed protein product [Lactuca saligna]|uniref:Uncharacterized protein n=1 Tax=Lactuca saligna TaxID=75948 RepID=A0AA36E3P6_LACSI|nr:unnamed protein product [Lactuca saligna]
MMMTNKLKFNTDLFSVLLCTVSLAEARPSGRVQLANESAETSAFSPLIGRKVRTRWPDDNNFYDSVITDYNLIEGRHAPVYDIRTANETWEWVNLVEVSVGS